MKDVIMTTKTENNTKFAKGDCPENRNSFRRSEDLSVQVTAIKHNQLLQVGQIITSEIDFDVLFDVVIKQTREIMNVERCSIFLLDEQGEMLNAFVSAGIDGLSIQVPKNKGIVGWVFNNREPVIVNNAYEDTRFYPEIDKISGLQTDNILCAPLVNRNSDCIGALEIINSKKGEFTNSDCETLIHLSNYITIALENARLYRELKMIDRAKERVINHLAHELTTPISILSGVISRLSKRLIKYEKDNVEKIVEMGNRNIQRLIELQTKAVDILKCGSTNETDILINLVTDAASIINDNTEEINQVDSILLKSIHDKIISIYQIGEIKIEKIHIGSFIGSLINDILSKCNRTEIHIQQIVNQKLTTYTDRIVLNRILFGIVKNAIENTPDEGNIEIKAYATDEYIAIDCVDHGVGISRKNQGQIFRGFYHTQETDMYSTKKPFSFNAGGAGLDLLRAKLLSDKLGFHINFVSKRCEFLALDSEQCPGKISICKHIVNKSQCYLSGGSTFSIKLSLTKTSV